ncbi:hypothetical protein [Pedobacter sp. SG908]|uniref:hypothetical protein n=1 Tax=Pedobacter sp. SG908 TaxID=2587135 RepID=UPI001422109A|nr:hypothetical protein [Pedobacter sp. SG908]NII83299.1 hypothetical protein [Pedobacter sp. SG908]
MKNTIKLTALALFSISSLMVNAQTRDNAGLQGDAGAVSGFFETVNPVNYPVGASSWWHLLDVRHSNNNNNYAMQFAGGFFDQELYFRKTNGSPSQQWSRVLMETNGSAYLGTGAPVNHDGWEKFFGVKANAHAKVTVETNNVISGIWSHNLGYYGAPAGGITGTYSNHPFSIITGAATRLTISNNGNVGIGTTSPAEKLAVNGNIRAKEIKVEATNWPDYVFEKKYQIASLGELEKYIKTNKHLPEMPSATEVESNGVELGDLVKKLLKNQEELTLHLIAQQKTIKALEEKIISQQSLKTKSKRR